MATITSAQSGNWSAGSTWVGGVAPVATDDIIVAAGHAVTLDAAFVVEKSLTLNGKLDTLTYALTIGNGASKDGTLTLGPGAELALGSGGMVLNNCALLSTATASEWAKVTGTGSITRGTVYASPKQRIVPKYVSFQTTGAITLGAGNSLGAIANPTLDLTNTVFVGCGALSFGQSGWSAQGATDMIFRRMDCRDTGHIRISGHTGATTGQSVWEDVTFYHATGTIDVSVIGRPNMQFRGGVFDSGTWGVAQVHGQGGGHDLDNCLFMQYEGRAGTGGSFAGMGSSANTASGEMRGCYAMSNLQNTHGVNAGGSGLPVDPIRIAENVFEFQSIDNPVADDTGNFIIYGSPRLFVEQNLCLGMAVNLVGAAGTQVSPQGIDVVRNTVYCRERAIRPTIVQALMLYEGGPEVYSGADTIHSNLVRGDVPVEYAIQDNSTSVQETVAFSDYNWFSGVTQPYKDVTVSGRALNEPGPNDKYGAAATDPQFVDPSRDLAAYAVHKGWASAGAPGDTKRAAAMERFRAINGYDPATKTQSATPSGASIADLVSWVKAGFAPRNQALKGAGYGGVDIGAMEVAAASVDPVDPPAPGAYSRYGVTPFGQQPYGVTPWGV